VKLLWPLLFLASAACVPPAGEDVQPQPAVATQEAAGPAISGQAVAEQNAAFGVELYKQLSGAPGNLFVSPISIAGAFGPAAAGAQGETRSAIDAAMRFGSGAGLHPALGGLLRDLEGPREGATLSIANALWVKQGFALKPEFARIGREDYAARVEEVDFERAPAAAAKRINSWVSEETKGRIKDLISADSLDGYTRLVITNAVYFLADWQTPFNAGATRTEPFFGPAGETRQVPLMRRRNHFRYFETSAFQAIDLPYKDERLSMSVFLPRARGGLGGFETQLSAERLKDWLGQLDREQPREVILFLPKLKIEEKYDLIPPLRTMGMGIAFTDKANFRGIAEEDMLISQVLHKTFLRIDEKGTEAAAATGIEIQTTSAPISEPPTFRADHPFFLVIRDKTSGAILFMGRIVAPGPV
jgi:serpin B